MASFCVFRQHLLEDACSFWLLWRPCVSMGTRGWLVHGPSFFPEDFPRLCNLCSRTFFPQGPMCLCSSRAGATGRCTPPSEPLSAVTARQVGAQCLLSGTEQSREQCLQGGGLGTLDSSPLCLGAALAGKWLSLAAIRCS